MTETKYGKYIVTQLTPPMVNDWAPVYKPDELTTVLSLDDDVIKGAFYVECAWFWPTYPVNDTSGRLDLHSHYHDYDEVLALFGTDMKDPSDLCGEVEVWLDGEKHIITKSSLVFIPKGLVHGPIKWNRIDKPIFHFACGTGKKHTSK
ncbi:MAG: hypothetical protein PHU23_13310 [Dehalococcoidales bacterium]|nr:hypothetical protein [Dehalococcoidales bacterium]